MLGYPFTPHTIHYSNPDESPRLRYSRGKAQADARYEVERQLSYYNTYLIDDIEHVAVLSALKNTTNATTLALANDRIPSSLTPDDTLRFLIAFLHERAIEKELLFQEAYENIVYTPVEEDYIIGGINVTPYLHRWLDRAEKIVELSKWYEANILPLSFNSDFIRNSAKVILGEDIGVKIQTSSSPCQIGVANARGIRSFYEVPANSTIYVPTLNGVYNAAGATESTARPVTLTGVNGASFVQTYTGTSVANPTRNAPHLLGKDATYQLTFQLMRHNITSTVLPAPTATRELANVSLAVGVTESVDLTGLFTGTRLTITATSDDTAVATVQLNDARTSLGVIGVKAGNTKVTVTGTNESAAVPVEFDVRVTAASN